MVYRLKYNRHKALHMAYSARSRRFQADLINLVFINDYFLHKNTYLLFGNVNNVTSTIANYHACNLCVCVFLSLC